MNTANKYNTLRNIWGFFNSPLKDGGVGSTWQDEGSTPRKKLPSKCGRPRRKHLSGKSLYLFFLALSVGKSDSLNELALQRDRLLPAIGTGLVSSSKPNLCLTSASCSKPHLCPA
eukprot:jgi/Botrbrau1/814/Bobra.0352s0011.1